MSVVAFDDTTLVQVCPRYSGVNNGKAFGITFTTKGILVPIVYGTAITQAVLDDDQERIKYYTELNAAMFGNAKSLLITPHGDFLHLRLYLESGEGPRIRFLEQPTWGETVFIADGGMTSANISTILETVKTPVELVEKAIDHCEIRSNYKVYNIPKLLKKYHKWLAKQTKK